LLIVQSVDAFIARMLIKECHKSGFGIISIHDSFACQYQYMPQMQAIYSKIIELLVKIDLFNSISLEISGGKLGFAKSPDLQGMYAKRSNEHKIC